jgi:hypothetical protein
MFEVPASVDDTSSRKWQRVAPKINPSPGRHTEHSIIVNILLILCDGQICTHHKVKDITSRSSNFPTIIKLATIFINPLRDPSVTLSIASSPREIVDDDDE